MKKPNPGDVVKRHNTEVRILDRLNLSKRIQRYIFAGALAFGAASGVAVNKIPNENRTPVSIPLFVSGMGLSLASTIERGQSHRKSRQYVSEYQALTGQRRSGHHKTVLTIQGGGLQAKEHQDLQSNDANFSSLPSVIGGAVLLSSSTSLTMASALTVEHGPEISGGQAAFVAVGLTVGSLILRADGNSVDFRMQAYRNQLDNIDGGIVIADQPTAQ